MKIKKSDLCIFFLLSLVALVPSACQASPKDKVPDNMVWISGGTFTMGSAKGYADEQPMHQVTLDGFYMDVTEVTNEQFTAFVKATKYITVAERPLDPKDFPGAPKELLVPGALVFSPPKEGLPIRGEQDWWSYVPGACWKHPAGKNSDLKGKENHPVVHIAWEDAKAYATWAGKDLPTEAQWEFAARGGVEKNVYVWGNKKNPDGKHMANIWQGKFPYSNSKKDGFITTAPVKSFQPNTFGLYDMSGNVWEWCNDWYRPDYYKRSSKKNPLGPKNSFDPQEPGVPKKVIRGGSFLCSDVYCTGYRPSARMKTSVDTGLSHLGFRCVINPKKPKD